MNQYVNMKQQYKYTRYTVKMPIWLKRMILNTWKSMRMLQLQFGNNGYEPKCIILGFQKSGTTAIAFLFSEATKMSLAAELKTAMLYPDLYQDVFEGKIDFDTFVNKNKIDFSFDILKEGFLNYFAKELVQKFPNTKFAFIVRDPFQAIRSISNRLHVQPGMSLEEIKPNISPTWYLLLSGIPLKPENRSDDYVTNLARLWVLSNDKYEEVKDDCMFISYEDFNKNKAGVIKQMCTEMGFEYKQDISALVDVNYNIKGKAKINLADFFGDYKSVIQRECAKYLS